MSGTLLTRHGLIPRMGPGSSSRALLGGGGAGAVSYSAEAEAFFARLDALGETLTASQKAAYDNFYQRLSYAGVLTTRDIIWLEGPTAVITRQNLAQDAFNLTVVGAAVFAAGGYTGANGAGIYLESGLDPTVGTPNYARNSNSLLAYRNTAPVGDLGGLAGIYPDVFMLADYTGDDFYSAAAGAMLVVTVASSGRSIGRYVAKRADASTGAASLNGAPVSSGALASSAFTAGKTLQWLNDGLGRNDGTTSQIRAGVAGSYTTAADDRNIDSAIVNFFLDMAGGTTDPILGFSSDIVADGAGNITPGIARLADGRLFAAYAIGTNQDDCKIVYHTSSDNGKTWSTSTDIATPAAGHTYTDIRVTVSPTSNAIILSCMYQANDESTCTIKIFKGTVDGLDITFGAAIGVTTSNANPASSSSPFKLLDGRWALPFYIFTGGTNGAYLIFSPDEDFDTWESEVAVAVSGGDNQYSEAEYVQFADGTIFGVLRTDAVGFWSVTGNAAGSSWSSPVQIFDETLAGAPSHPSLVLMPDERLFLLSRFTGPANDNQTGYSWSTDDGATWTAPAIYYNPAGAFSYGANVQNQAFYDATTGTIMSVIGLGSFSAARITFQQFEW